MPLKPTKCQMDYRLVCLVYINCIALKLHQNASYTHKIEHFAPAWLLSVFCTCWFSDQSLSLLGPPSSAGPPSPKLPFAPRYCYDCPRHPIRYQHVLMLHQTVTRFHIFSFTFCLNGEHVLHVHQSILTKIIHFLDSMFTRIDLQPLSLETVSSLDHYDHAVTPQPFPAIRSWSVAATVPCRSVSVRLNDVWWHVAPRANKSWTTDSFAGTGKLKHAASICSWSTSTGLSAPLVNIKVFGWH